MENIEPIRPATAPLLGALVMPVKDTMNEAKNSTPDEKFEKGAGLIESEGRIFQARLSYDPESAEVFIEILDPTTGDVIRRFPAEEAAEKQSAFRQGGRLVDQDA